MFPVHTALCTLRTSIHLKIYGTCRDVGMTKILKGAMSFKVVQYRAGYLLNALFKKNIYWRLGNSVQIWCTAFPYRASTGPEQGFPCVLFPHREKPVYISWDPCNENRIFPVGKSTQGKPCFHYRVPR